MTVNALSGINLARRLSAALARGAEYLGPSAELIGLTISESQNADGGFPGRDGKSDVYYTCFALACLHAVNAEFDRDRLRRFLDRFDDGEMFDFIHLTALAQCRAILSLNPFGKFKGRIHHRLETYRCKDCGFHTSAERTSGSPYGAFLYMLTVGAMLRPLRNVQSIVRTVESCRVPGGGFANDLGADCASVPATAAAIAVSAAAGKKIRVDEDIGFLMRCFDNGGFRENPESPCADLLSMAVALFALNIAGVSMQDYRSLSLDFLESCWNEKGGFHAHVYDSVTDSEYAFYGLLAAGSA